ncbi:hypothetical protein CALVIDRAFT_385109 [Calocera viscosa TUFC12733]|uniref:Uncharacterized protein n=1 Tax=Calocera viscosa (strain TUFC12733) TaxID=1330018 RepID=A0A167Q8X3_CALVF|nr:hypothetical protein CALVIDRAFT_385109 [Calocera viscosa TUFC12733]
MNTQLLRKPFSSSRPLLPISAFCSPCGAAHCHCVTITDVVVVCSCPAAELSPARQFSWEQAQPRRVTLQHPEGTTTAPRRQHQQRQIANPSSAFLRLSTFCHHSFRCIFVLSPERLLGHVPLYHSSAGSGAIFSTVLRRGPPITAPSQAKCHTRHLTRGRSMRSEEASEYAG